LAQLCASLNYVHFSRGSEMVEAIGGDNPLALKLRLPKSRILCGADPPTSELSWAAEFFVHRGNFLAGIETPKGRAPTADSGWTASEPDTERSGIGRFQDNLRPMR
jgi:hypothetical protein